MSTPDSHLAVPDPLTLSAVQQLCDIDNPYNQVEESEALFRKAMQEAVVWHGERSEFYRRLIDFRKFDVQGLESGGSCADVPYVFANFFKTHTVKSVADDEIATHLTSSGTTGQKSQMFFDEWTLGSAQRMVDYIFRYYDWVSDKPVNYLLYSYEQKPGMKLGTAYTDNFLCKYAPVNEVYSAIRYVNATKHEFDAFGSINVLQRYEDQGLPVRIFGFPAFLYFTLQRMAEIGVPPLNLSDDSLIFLGGGWKGHQNQAIDKRDLYKMVNEQLGIPDHRIRDGFGSVEHCVPYVECSSHNFHVPIYSRVFIRDLESLDVLGPGEPGFLQFVSPYITSVPGISVLMGDLASWYEGGSCDCELDTPYFIVHGRAGTSKNKSCAIAAAELLGGK